jgi:hypothetical protein
LIFVRKYDTRHDGKIVSVSTLSGFTLIVVASYGVFFVAVVFASFATSSALPRGLSCMGWTYEP